jgi:hypothetical protein
VDLEIFSRIRRANSRPTPIAKLSCNVLFGVGVVENGYGQTAQIGVCRSDDILEMEKRLFQQARQFAPALPLDEADVIIITQSASKKSRLKAAATPLRNRVAEYTDWFENEMID